MPVYNGNNVYLEIDGINVSAFFTDEVSYTETRNTQDTTAGAGTEDMQRGVGLNDVSFELMLVHDAAAWDTYKGVFGRGIKKVVYGMDTNANGKPKFAGDMIIESVSSGVSIERTKVVHNVSFVQAGTPTDRIYADGSVFS